jgi:hypothetical protein
MGQTCPRCAADDWLLYLGPLWQDQDGQTRIAKTLTPDLRTALLAQRRTWLGAVTEDGGKHPSMAAPTFVSAAEDGSRT